MVWCSHLFKSFSQFVMIHIVKGFSGADEAEVDVMFFWNSLAFSMIQQCWQFDLWFLCLFKTELVYLEVLSSHTSEI